MESPACSLIIAAALLAALAPVGAPAATISEYPIPTAESHPYGITAGPDGNLWFTETYGSKIGKVTPGGVFAEYSLPGTDSRPYGITAGPDGNLWFTTYTAIGKVTPAGVVTEYPLPPDSLGQESSITAGPDGNLWFTGGPLRDKIGKMTPAGIHTQYSLPFGSVGPMGITVGPDGNLWFTERYGNNIGKITPAGVLTEYPLPTALSYPSEITAGPDGNLWFTYWVEKKIGKITPAGVLTEYALPTAYGAASGITAGPDGNLWFTEFEGGKVGKLTPAGAFLNEYHIPTAASGPYGITAGPDGNLWFTEIGGGGPMYGNKIGRLTPTSVAGCPTVPLNTCFGAGKSRVLFKDSSDNKRMFLWKWSRGAVMLTQADFGDPVNGSTNYMLCVYDETAGVPVLKMGLSVAPASQCGDTTPCWTTPGAYRNRIGNPDGVTKVRLKGGDAGKPQIQVRAKGLSLSLPAALSPTKFFDQDTAVLVQLHSSSPANCWASSFDGLRTKRNDGDQFNATAQ